MAETAHADDVSTIAAAVNGGRSLRPFNFRGFSTIPHAIADRLAAIWENSVRLLSSPLAGALMIRLLPAGRRLLAAFAFVGAGLMAGLAIEDDVTGLGWNRLFSGSLQLPIGLVCAIMLGTLASGRLRRAAATPGIVALAPCKDRLQQAVELLARQDNAAAGLVRLGDKHVLFSACGEAFIMYARSGRSWIALFDPVGARQAWPALVARFMEEARRAGCRPVFYQVSPDFLPCAIELGLKPYKLGEQAVVDLKGFDMKGGDWLKLRRSVNRAARDGLEFAMLTREQVPEVLDELLAVSRAWLAAHNAAEKGFSLGTFEPGYVAASPVAVIRLEGRIVAFANILAASASGDAFIDLMRHVPDTHRGMMDLLFVKIMEHLKAEGFSTLNLGMAPLARLSTHIRAPLWNHIAHQVFDNGERFYNFRGVLAFKSKFDPQWHPRYLAVAGRGLPLLSVFDITMLIAGGIKGVFRK
ncbi:MAG: phosphatidylglycerol lysyltransferase domain-containing protein [Neorhizobium sp.]|nr:phosphatidylglycerol lysyltransferase domain-containing protein [Neorhizobium sp.]